MNTYKSNFLLNNRVISAERPVVNQCCRPYLMIREAGYQNAATRYSLSFLKF